MKETIDYFLARIEIQHNGCWTFTTCHQPNGYANMKVHGKTVYAHRWAYEYFNGPIPKGYEIDHKCHNLSDCAGGNTCPHRACVNPDHLDTCTRAENLHRSKNTRASINASRTHCPQGHSYSGDNLGHVIGARRCLACGRAKYRLWREKKNALLTG